MGEGEEGTCSKVHFACHVPSPDIRETWGGSEGEALKTERKKTARLLAPRVTHRGKKKKKKKTRKGGETRKKGTPQLQRSLRTLNVGVASGE